MVIPWQYYLWTWISAKHATLCSFAFRKVVLAQNKSKNNDYSNILEQKPSFQLHKSLFWCNTDDEAQPVTREMLRGVLEVAMEGRGPVSNIAMRGSREVAEPGDVRAFSCTVSFLKIFSENCMSLPFFL